MVVNHKKSMIQAYFDGCGSDYNIEYIMEEKPLGTGGGLSLIDSNNIGECFFLTNCDTIIDADYEEIYKYHVDSGNTITIVAAACKYTIPYGVIKRKEDCFVEMEEKPSLNFLINTGMYLVNREVLKIVPERAISFPEIIDIVKNSGNNRIGIYSIEEEAFMDMGRIEELEKMTAKLGLK